MLLVWLYFTLIWLKGRMNDLLTEFYKLSTARIHFPGVDIIQIVNSVTQLSANWKPLTQIESIAFNMILYYSLLDSVLYISYRFVIEAVVVLPQVLLPVM